MSPRGTYSKAQIDRIRDQTSIVEIVGRFVLWDNKKSKPQKRDMWACCPFHGEKEPSFHADDQRGIYKCFGCGASGDVFRFLMEKTGCSFPDAIAQLGGEKDIAEETMEQRLAREKRDQDSRDASERDRRRQEGNVRDSARGIWNGTTPIAGTLAETYLRNRGIHFPLTFPSLRFHPGLRHPDTGSRQHPALVAGMQAPDDSFLGVWRIYLDPVTGEKSAAVDNAKLGLGAYTEAGGGVRLGSPFGQVNLCEGIETGLGIVGITGGAPVIACLNTSGLINFQPPPDASSALIWPDGDVDRIRVVNGKETKIESPGHKAANQLLERMAAVDFPTAIQPTQKNGADYLDVWNRMNKRMNKHGG